jgi:NADP-dependent 3-hydroxy acid dehydrogenase YdfG
MTTRFSNDVVVVTGASAGIGKALAQELSRRGAKVVLAARRRDKLLEVASSLVGESLVVPTDVTRKAEVTALLKAALARFDRVDVWVNNVGRGITRGLLELTDNDVDAMVRDNVKSALYGMQVVLPHFKERRAGVLANVSSMLGRVPAFVPRAAYSAAKAALGSFTESLRFDLAQDFPRIRAVLVLPGIVATDFGTNALHGGPDSRALPGGQTAEEVAQIIADGLKEGPLDLYTRPDGPKRVLEHLKAADGGTSRSAVQST